MMTHFCWACWGELAAPTPVCSHCGGTAAEPPGTAHLDRLTWALDHPLVERRMIALKALAAIGDPAAWPAVHALLDSPDPYLAAEALRTLAALNPLAARPLIEHAGKGAHALMRTVAAELSRT